MSLTTGGDGPDFMTGSMERRMLEEARARAPVYPRAQEQTHPAERQGKGYVARFLEYIGLR